MLSDTARCSGSYTFTLPAPDLQSVISPRTSFCFVLFLFLSGKWYLEATIWALGVLIAIGMSLLPDAFQWTKPGNTCTCMQYTYLHTHRHTHIYISVYFCIYLYMLKTMCSHRHFQVQSSFTRFIVIFTLSMFVTLFSDITLNIFHLFYAPVSIQSTVFAASPSVGSDALL